MWHLICINIHILCFWLWCCITVANPLWFTSTRVVIKEDFCQHNHLRGDSGVPRPLSRWRQVFLYLPLVMFEVTSLRCWFQAPCRKLLNSVLRGLELTIFQSDRDIYIPNCDTRGFYREKQVRCHSHETCNFTDCSLLRCDVKMCLCCTDLVSLCVFLRVWELHSTAAFLCGASRDLSETTGAENNWHFSLWASQLWAQRISTALWWHIIFSLLLSLTTFPTLPLNLRPPSLSKSPSLSFNLTQCRSSKGMQRGHCWCVDELGTPVPSRASEDGTLPCDGEWGMSLSYCSEPGGRGEGGGRGGGGGGAGTQGEGVALACARHCLDRR